MHLKSASIPSRWKYCATRWKPPRRRWARCSSAPPSRPTSRSAWTPRARSSTPTAQLVAQAEHVPVHLGSMLRAVSTTVARFDALAEGDVILVNDPFIGGSHLPDVMVIAPVFHRRRAHRLCRDARAPGRHRRHGARLDARAFAGDLPGRPDHPAGEAVPRRQAAGGHPRARARQRAHAGRAPRRLQRPARRASGSASAA